ncbi:hypothetical protein TWF694_006808 [Orbilia ellipsospora]|uniref:L-ornithine N(5)-oxygenase n=1 Tax=Orbilia ellipsospora TaxID=2528407 RepID=A0AAV9XLP7_9PEZI
MDSESQYSKLVRKTISVEYGRFETKITSLKRDEDGRWSINNDPSFSKFDGIIAAVGTCGEPKLLKIHGEEKFKGQIYHSSELDSVKVRGKTVLIIGSGASAVKAVQFAIEASASNIKVLARSNGSFHETQSWISS